MWILPFVYSLVNNKTLFKSSADWKPTTGHTVLITSFGRRQMCNTTNFDRKHVSTAKLFIVSLNRASQLMANEWRNRMSSSARVMWMWNICWEWLELNTEPRLSTIINATTAINTAQVNGKSETNAMINWMFSFQWKYVFSERRSMLGFSVVRAAVAVILPTVPRYDAQHRYLTMAWADETRKHQHHDLVCVCNLFRYSRNPSCSRHFNFDYKTYSILKFSHYSANSTDALALTDRKRNIWAWARREWFPKAFVLKARMKKKNNNFSSIVLRTYKSLCSAYKMWNFQNGSVGSALKNMKMKNVAKFLFFAPVPLSGVCVCACLLPHKVAKVSFSVFPLFCEFQRQANEMGHNWIRAHTDFVF